jgi:hypothetical protein
MHRGLKPKGKAVVTSFHPTNPFKAFMDYIIDWKVTHRAEEELQELFAHSPFARPGSVLRFESQNIIFLAECTKA